MRSKSIVLLALALGCGLVASIGISQVMERRNQAGGPPGEVEPIVVALADIGATDPITDQNVKIEDWPRAKVPQGALTKLEEYLNKRARQKIFAGEPIIQAKIMDVSELKNASKEIPKGYRAVTVRVDNVSGAGSLLFPGDRVDVLVYLAKNPQHDVHETQTKTILQDIKVFAVDTTFERKPGQDDAAVAAKTISLLVTPAQAEKVYLASEMGTIRLVLRNEQDPQIVDGGSTGASDVLGTGILSSRTAEQPKPAQPVAAAPTTNAPGPDTQSLLDVIKELKNKKPAVKAEAGPWKMLVLSGPEVKEVEVNSDGLPVIIGEAGNDSPPAPVQPANPDSTSDQPSSNEDPAVNTPDAANGSTDQGPHVSLKD